MLVSHVIPRYLKKNKIEDNLAKFIEFIIWKYLTVHHRVLIFLLFVVSLLSTNSFVSKYTNQSPQLRDDSSHSGDEIRKSNDFGILFSLRQYTN
jgi:hypothetical protein